MITRTALTPSASLGRALDLCTGDAHTFVRETWCRRAAIHTPGSAREAQELLSLDDVDRILSTMSLRTPMFRVVKEGNSLPEETYTRAGRTGSKPVTGMADPARIFEHFDQGATIVLQGLHRFWEPVACFARDLELVLGHPCQVNAYVTPPGAAGLSLHSDPHDVFVLQTFGRKHWEIHSAPKEPKRAPIAALLEPGDCIYMPKGTPHVAVTHEALSGHLTIGINTVTWRDILTDTWLDADPSLDDALPAGWTSLSEAPVEELTDRLARLGRALARVDVAGIVSARAEAFLSTRLPLVRGALVDRMSVRDLNDRTLLRRRPGTICELRRSGEGLHVLLGDRRLDMPRWLEPAMRRIASLEIFAVGDLASELPDGESRLILARRLVREALLTVER